MKARVSIVAASLVSSAAAHTDGEKGHHANESSQGVTSLASGYPEWTAAGVAVATAAVIFLAGLAVLHRKGLVDI